MNNMMQSNTFSQSTGNAVAPQTIQSQFMNNHQAAVISENNLLMNPGNSALNN